MKLHNRAEATLKLKKAAAGAVTAADIEQTHDVEIINPDHVIAHLTFGLGFGELFGAATGCLLLWLLRRLAPPTG